MNIDIPELKCVISLENFALNGSIVNKRSLKDARLKLCRNMVGDCVLSIVDNKHAKEVKQFTFVKGQENYRLNTKFVIEGKASITLQDLNLRIFISNCPPDDLSLFLKGFSLKCYYYSKNDPNKNETAFGLMTRDVSNIKRSRNETIEKISPLTSKDMIRNLALRDQTNTNKGLGKTSLSSPVSSKRAFQKRKLENGMCPTMKFVVQCTICCLFAALEVISDSSPNTKKRLAKQIIPSPVRSLRVLNSNSLSDDQHKVLR